VFDNEQTAMRGHSWPTKTSRQAARILTIMHSDTAQGPPQHVFPWLAHLAHGSRVEVVVPGRGSTADLYATIGPVSTLGYESITYPGGLSDLISLTPRLQQEIRVFRRHIRETSPDLVFVITSAVPTALVAARLERRPVIVYVGEILDKGFVRSGGRSLAGAALIRVLGTADALVCCSDAVARQFSTAEKRRIVTIYPGVDTAYADGDGDRFRAAHGLTDASPCIAVVGNVSRGRGQDLAVRALPLVREQLPNAHCVVAGLPHPRPVDVAYRRELASIAEELGVEERVVFVGFVERMADLYAAADIVVNPARFHEPFGRVAIEAMSAGRPLIAARVGAIPEIMRHEREALLVDPDDHEALARAVVRLWNDPRLREHLVQAGKRLVAERFDELAGIEAFAAVVDEILGRSSVRRVGASRGRGP
jgi:glycosyltransferase involved in cell wall biosynthesis